MTHNALKPRFPTENYLNRELGLLAFNRRVLAQAEDERMPLLERLRFLCIVSSNLDEFFEIRVAGLKEQLKLNSVSVTADGLTASAAYALVSSEAHALVAELALSALLALPLRDGARVSVFGVRERRSV